MAQKSRENASDSALFWAAVCAEEVKDILDSGVCLVRQAHYKCIERRSKSHTQSGSNPSIGNEPTSIRLVPGIYGTVSTIAIGSITLKAAIPAGLLLPLAGRAVEL